MIPFANADRVFAILEILLFVIVGLFPTEIYPALANANELLREPFQSNAIDSSAPSGPDLSPHYADNERNANQQRHREINPTYVWKRSADKSMERRAAPPDYAMENHVESMLQSVMRDIEEEIKNNPEIEKAEEKQLLYSSAFRNRIKEYIVKMEKSHAKTSWISERQAPEPMKEDQNGMQQNMPPVLYWSAPYSPSLLWNSYLSNNYQKTQKNLVAAGEMNPLTAADCNEQILNVNQTYKSDQCVLFNRNLNIEQSRTLNAKPIEEPKPKPKSGQKDKVTKTLASQNMNTTTKTMQKDLTITLRTTHFPKNFGTINQNTEMSTRMIHTRNIRTRTEDFLNENITIPEETTTLKLQKQDDLSDPDDNKDESSLRSKLTMHFRMKLPDDHNNRHGRLQKEDNPQLNEEDRDVSIGETRSTTLQSEMHNVSTIQSSHKRPRHYLIPTTTPISPKKMKTIRSSSIVPAYSMSKNRGHKPIKLLVQIYRRKRDFSVPRVKRNFVELPVMEIEGRIQPGDRSRYSQIEHHRRSIDAVVPREKLHFAGNTYDFSANLEKMAHRRNSGHMRNNVALIYTDKLPVPIENVKILNHATANEKLPDEFEAFEIEEIAAHFDDYARQRSDPYNTFPSINELSMKNEQNSRNNYDYLTRKDRRSSKSHHGNRRSVTILKTKAFSRGVLGFESEDNAYSLVAGPGVGSSKESRTGDRMQQINRQAGLKVKAQAWHGDDFVGDHATTAKQLIGDDYFLRPEVRRVRQSNTDERFVVPDRVSKRQVVQCTPFGCKVPGKAANPYIESHIESSQTGNHSYFQEIPPGLYDKQNNITTTLSENTATMAPIQVTESITTTELYGKTEDGGKTTIFGANGEVTTLKSDNVIKAETETTTMKEIDGKVKTGKPDATTKPEVETTITKGKDEEVPTSKPGEPNNENERTTTTIKEKDEEGSTSTPDGTTKTEDEPSATKGTDEEVTNSDSDVYTKAENEETITKENDGEVTTSKPDAAENSENEPVSMKETEEGVTNSESDTATANENELTATNNPDVEATTSASDAIEENENEQANTDKVDESTAISKRSKFRKIIKGAHNHSDMMNTAPKNITQKLYSELFDKNMTDSILEHEKYRAEPPSDASSKLDYNERNVTNINNTKTIGNTVPTGLHMIQTKESSSHDLKIDFSTSASENKLKRQNYDGIRSDDRGVRDEIEAFSSNMHPDNETKGKGYKSRDKDILRLKYDHNNSDSVIKDEGKATETSEIHSEKDITQVQADHNKSSKNKPPDELMEHYSSLDLTPEFLEELSPTHKLRKRGILVENDRLQAYVDPPPRTYVEQRSVQFMDEVISKQNPGYVRDYYKNIKKIVRSVNEDNQALGNVEDGILNRARPGNNSRSTRRVETMIPKIQYIQEGTDNVDEGPTSTQSSKRPRNSLSRRTEKNPKTAEKTTLPIWKWIKRSERMPHASAIPIDGFPNLYMYNFILVPSAENAMVPIREDSHLPLPNNYSLASSGYSVQDRMIWGSGNVLRVVKGAFVYDGTETFVIQSRVGKGKVVIYSGFRSAEGLTKLEDNVLEIKVSFDATQGGEIRVYEAGSGGQTEQWMIADGSSLMAAGRMSLDGEGTWAATILESKKSSRYRLDYKIFSGLLTKPSHWAAVSYDAMLINGRIFGKARFPIGHSGKFEMYVMDETAVLMIISYRNRNVIHYKCSVLMQYKRPGSQGDADPEERIKALRTNPRRWASKENEGGKNSRKLRRPYRETNNAASDEQEDASSAVDDAKVSEGTILPKKVVVEESTTSKTMKGLRDEDSSEKDQIQDRDRGNDPDEHLPSNDPFEQLADTLETAQGKVRYYHFRHNITQMLGNHSGDILYCTVKDNSTEISIGGKGNVATSVKGVRVSAGDARRVSARVGKGDIMINASIIHEEFMSATVDFQDDILTAEFTMDITADQHENVIRVNERGNGTGAELFLSCDGKNVMGAGSIDFDGVGKWAGGISSFDRHGNTARHRAFSGLVFSRPVTWSELVSHDAWMEGSRIKMKATLPSGGSSKIRLIVFNNENVFLTMTYGESTYARIYCYAELLLAGDARKPTRSRRDALNFPRPLSLDYALDNILMEAIRIQKRPRKRSVAEHEIVSGEVSKEQGAGELHGASLEREKQEEHQDPRTEHHSSNEEMKSVPNVHKEHRDAANTMNSIEKDDKLLTITSNENHSDKTEIIQIAPERNKNNSTILKTIEEDSSRDTTENVRSYRSDIVTATYPATKNTESEFTDHLEHVADTVHSSHNTEMVTAGINPDEIIKVTVNSGPTKITVNGDQIRNRVASLKKEKIATANEIKAIMRRDFKQTEEESPEEDVEHRSGRENMHVPEDRRQPEEDNTRLGESREHTEKENHVRAQERSHEEADTRKSVKVVNGEENESSLPQERFRVTGDPRMGRLIGSLEEDNSEDHGNTPSHKEDHKYVHQVVKLEVIVPKHRPQSSMLRGPATKISMKKRTTTETSYNVLDVVPEEDVTYQRLFSVTESIRDGISTDSNTSGDTEDMNSVNENAVSPLPTESDVKYSTQRVTMDKVELVIETTTPEKSNSNAKTIQIINKKDGATVRKPKNEGKNINTKFTKIVKLAKSSAIKATKIQKPQITSAKATKKKTPTKSTQIAKKVQPKKITRNTPARESYKPAVRRIRSVPILNFESNEPKKALNKVRLPTRYVVAPKTDSKINVKHINETTMRGKNNTLGLERKDGKWSNTRGKQDRSSKVKMNGNLHGETTTGKPKMNGSKTDSPTTDKNNRTKVQDIQYIIPGPITLLGQFPGPSQMQHMPSPMVPMPYPGQPMGIVAMGPSVYIPMPSSDACNPNQNTNSPPKQAARNSFNQSPSRLQRSGIMEPVNTGNRSAITFDFIKPTNVSLIAVEEPKFKLKPYSTKNEQIGNVNKGVYITSKYFSLNNKFLHPKRSDDTSEKKFSTKLPHSDKILLSRKKSHSIVVPFTYNFIKTESHNNRSVSKQFAGHISSNNFTSRTKRYLNDNIMRNGNRLDKMESLENDRSDPTSNARDIEDRFNWGSEETHFQSERHDTISRKSGRKLLALESLRTMGLLGNEQKDNNVVLSANMKLPDKPSPLSIEDSGSEDMDDVSENDSEDEEDNVALCDKESHSEVRFGASGNPIVPQIAPIKKSMNVTTLEPDLSMGTRKLFEAIMKPFTKNMTKMPRLTFQEKSQANSIETVLWNDPKNSTNSFIKKFLRYKNRKMTPKRMNGVDRKNKISYKQSKFEVSKRARTGKSTPILQETLRYTSSSQGKHRVAKNGDRAKNEKTIVESSVMISSTQKPTPEIGNTNGKEDAVKLLQSGSGYGGIYSRDLGLYNGNPFIASYFGPTLDRLGPNPMNELLQTGWLKVPAMSLIGNSLPQGPRTFSGRFEERKSPASYMEIPTIQPRHPLITQHHDHRYRSEFPTEKELQTLLALEKGEPQPVYSADLGSHTDFEHPINESILVHNIGYSIAMMKKKSPTNRRKREAKFNDLELPDRFKIKRAVKIIEVDDDDENVTKVGEQEATDEILTKVGEGQVDRLIQMITSEVDGNVVIQRRVIKKSSSHQHSRSEPISQMTKSKFDTLDEVEKEQIKFDDSKTKDEAKVYKDIGGKRDATKTGDEIQMSKDHISETKSAAILKLNKGPNNYFANDNKGEEDDKKSEKTGKTQGLYGNLIKERDIEKNYEPITFQANNNPKKLSDIAGSYVNKHNHIFSKILKVKKSYETDPHRGDDPGLFAVEKTRKDPSPYQVAFRETDESDNSNNEKDSPRKLGLKPIVEKSDNSLSDAVEIGKVGNLETISDFPVKTVYEIKQKRPKVRYYRDETSKIYGSWDKFRRIDPRNRDDLSSVVNKYKSKKIVNAGQKYKGQRYDDSSNMEWKRNLKKQNSNADSSDIQIEIEPNDYYGLIVSRPEKLVDSNVNNDQNLHFVPKYKVKRSVSRQAYTDSEMDFQTGLDYNTIKDTADEIKKRTRQMSDVDDQSIKSKEYYERRYRVSNNDSESKTAKMNNFGKTTPIDRASLKNVELSTVKSSFYKFPEDYNFSKYRDDEGKGLKIQKKKHDAYGTQDWKYFKSISTVLDNSEMSVLKDFQSLADNELDAKYNKDLMTIVFALDVEDVEFNGKSGKLGAARSEKTDNIFHPEDEILMIKSETEILAKFANDKQLNNDNELYKRRQLTEQANNIDGFEVSIGDSISNLENTEKMLWKPLIGNNLNLKQINVDSRTIPNCRPPNNNLNLIDETENVTNALNSNPITQMQNSNQKTVPETSKTLQPQVTATSYLPYEYVEVSPNSREEEVDKYDLSPNEYKKITEHRRQYRETTQLANNYKDLYDNMNYEQDQVFELDIRNQSMEDAGPDIQMDYNDFHTSLDEQNRNLETPEVDTYVLSLASDGVTTIKSIENAKKMPVNREQAFPDGEDTLKKPEDNRLSTSGVRNDKMKITFVDGSRTDIAIRLNHTLKLENTSTETNSHLLTDLLVMTDKPSFPDLNIIKQNVSLALKRKTEFITKETLFHRHEKKDIKSSSESIRIGKSQVVYDKPGEETVEDIYDLDEGLARSKNETVPGPNEGTLRNHDLVGTETGICENPKDYNKDRKFSTTGDNKKTKETVEKLHTKPRRNREKSKSKSGHHRVHCNKTHTPVQQGDVLLDAEENMDYVEIIPKPIQLPEDFVRRTSLVQEIKTLLGNNLQNLMKLNGKSRNLTKTPKVSRNVLDYVTSTAFKMETEKFEDKLKEILRNTDSSVETEKMEGPRHKREIKVASAQKKNAPQEVKVVFKQFPKEEPVAMTTTQEIPKPGTTIVPTEIKMKATNGSGRKKPKSVVKKATQLNGTILKTSNRTMPELDSSEKQLNVTINYESKEIRQKTDAKKWDKDEMGDQRKQPAARSKLNLPDDEESTTNATVVDVKLLRNLEPTMNLPEDEKNDSMKRSPRRISGHPPKVTNEIEVDFSQDREKTVHVDTRVTYNDSGADINNSSETDPKIQNLHEPNPVLFMLVMPHGKKASINNDNDTDLDLDLNKYGSISSQRNMFEDERRKRSRNTLLRNAHFKYNNNVPRIPDKSFIPGLPNWPLDMPGWSVQQHKNSFLNKNPHEANFFPPDYNKYDTRSKGFNNGPNNNPNDRFAIQKVQENRVYNGESSRGNDHITANNLGSRDDPMVKNSFVPREGKSRYKSVPNRKMHKKLKEARDDHVDEDMDVEIEIDWGPEPRKVKSKKTKKNENQNQNSNNDYRSIIFNPPNNNTNGYQIETFNNDNLMLNRGENNMPSHPIITDLMFDNVDAFNNGHKSNYNSNDQLNHLFAYTDSPMNHNGFNRLNQNNFGHNWNFGNQPNSSFDWRSYGKNVISPSFQVNSVRGFNEQENNFRKYHMTNINGKTFANQGNIHNKQKYQGNNIILHNDQMVHFNDHDRGRYKENKANSLRRGQSINNVKNIKYHANNVNNPDVALDNSENNVPEYPANGINLPDASMKNFGATKPKIEETEPPKIQNVANETIKHVKSNIGNKHFSSGPHQRSNHPLDNTSTTFDPHKKKSRTKGKSVHNKVKNVDKTRKSNWKDETELEATDTTMTTKLINADKRKTVEAKEKIPKNPRTVNSEWNNSSVSSVQIRRNDNGVTPNKLKPMYKHSHDIAEEDFDGKQADKVFISFDQMDESKSFESLFRATKKGVYAKPPESQIPFDELIDNKSSTKNTSMGAGKREYPPQRHNDNASMNNTVLRKDPRKSLKELNMTAANWKNNNRDTRYDTSEIRKSYQRVENGLQSTTKVVPIPGYKMYQGLRTKAPKNTSVEVAGSASLKGLRNAGKDETTASNLNEQPQTEIQDARRKQDIISTILRQSFRKLNNFDRMMNGKGKNTSRYYDYGALSPKNSASIENSKGIDSKTSTARKGTFDRKTLFDRKLRDVEENLEDTQTQKSIITIFQTPDNSQKKYDSNHNDKSDKDLKQLDIRKHNEEISQKWNNEERLDFKEVIKDQIDLKGTNRENLDLRPKNREMFDSNGGNKDAVPYKRLNKEVSDYNEPYQENVYANSEHKEASKGANSEAKDPKEGNKEVIEDKDNKEMITEIINLKGLYKEDVDLRYKDYDSTLSADRAMKEPQQKEINSPTTTNQEQGSSKQNNARDTIKESTNRRELDAYYENYGPNVRKGDMKKYPAKSYGSSDYDGNNEEMSEIPETDRSKREAISSHIRVDQRDLDFPKFDEIPRIEDADERSRRDMADDLKNEWRGNGETIYRTKREPVVNVSPFKSTEIISKNWYAIENPEKTNLSKKGDNLFVLRNPVESETLTNAEIKIQKDKGLLIMEKVGNQQDLIVFDLKKSLPENRTEPFSEEVFKGQPMDGRIHLKEKMFFNRESLDETVPLMGKYVEKKSFYYRPKKNEPFTWRQSRGTLGSWQTDISGEENNNTSATQEQSSNGEGVGDNGVRVKVMGNGPSGPSAEIPQSGYYYGYSQNPSPRYAQAYNLQGYANINPNSNPVNMGFIQQPQSMNELGQGYGSSGSSPKVNLGNLGIPNRRSNSNTYGRSLEMPAGVASARDNLGLANAVGQYEKAFGRSNELVINFPPAQKNFASVNQHPNALPGFKNMEVQRQMHYSIGDQGKHFQNNFNRQNKELNNLNYVQRVKNVQFPHGSPVHSSEYMQMIPANNFNIPLQLPFGTFKKHDSEKYMSPVVQTNDNFRVNSFNAQTAPGSNQGQYQYSNQIAQMGQPQPTSQGQPAQNGYQYSKQIPSKGQQQSTAQGQPEYQYANPMTSLVQPTGQAQAGQSGYQYSIQVPVMGQKLSGQQQHQIPRQVPMLPTSSQNVRSQISRVKENMFAFYNNLYS